MFVHVIGCVYFLKIIIKKNVKYAKINWLSQLRFFKGTSIL